MRDEVLGKLGADRKVRHDGVNDATRVVAEVINAALQYALQRLVRVVRRAAEARKLSNDPFFIEKVRDIADCI